MRTPTPRALLVLLPLAAAASLSAQGRVVVPAVAADLPGNAAVSMPLRWSHGSLQLLIDAALLPTSLTGQQLNGMRLRRPAFLGEPPYGGVTRTMVVRAGFTNQPAQNMTPDRLSNVPAGVVTVAGPAQFPVAPSGPPTAPDTLGDEFLVIPFATPLPVAPGNLFVEFETTDAPLVVGDVWVDAVWLDGGVDRGYAVPVGDGSCTLSTAPLHLQWNGGSPLRGTDARLRLTGAPAASGTGAGALVFAWVGVEPLTRPVAPDPFYLGWGGNLSVLDAALAGCFQWAPLDLTWFGSTDAGGGFDVQFPLPPGVTTVGMRLGVQTAFVDPARSGSLPLSVSNGVVLVLDSAGVDAHCSSLFFPGTAVTSPWGPQPGLMPVLVLEY